MNNIRYNRCIARPTKNKFKFHYCKLIIIVIERICLKRMWLLLNSWWNGQGIGGRNRSAENVRKALPSGVSTVLNISSFLVIGNKDLKKMKSTLPINLPNLVLNNLEAGSRRNAYSKDIPRFLQLLTTDQPGMGTSLLEINAIGNNIISVKSFLDPFLCLLHILAVRRLPWTRITWETCQCFGNWRNSCLNNTFNYCLHAVINNGKTNDSSMKFQGNGEGEPVSFSPAFTIAQLNSLKKSQWEQTDRSIAVKDWVGGWKQINEPVLKRETLWLERIYSTERLLPSISAPPQRGMCLLKSPNRKKGASNCLTRVSKSDWS